MSHYKSACGHDQLPRSVRWTHESAVERHGAQFLLDRRPKLFPEGFRDIISAPPQATPPVDYPHAQENCDSVRVFYLSHCVSPRDIPRMLTDVPAVCVDGDKYIRYQNGQDGSYTYDPAALLSYGERRSARKKLIASMATVFAAGGYGKSKPIPYARPANVVLLSAAGCQFEMPHLEAHDFIISAEEDAYAQKFHPVFPLYYPHSNFTKMSLQAVLDLKKDPSRSTHGMLKAGNFEQICKDAQGRPVFLDLQAYFLSCREDAFLILSAFDKMVEQKNRTDGCVDARKGLLKISGIGMGFFARYMMAIQLTEHLMPQLLSAFCSVMKEVHFPHIAFVEFSDFTGGKFTPPEAFYGSICISKPQFTRDLLDFSEEELAQFVCGALNAGDAFCLPGNEYGYRSVESMIACNTDIRLVQSYVFNPKVLDPERACPVQYYILSDVSDHLIASLPQLLVGVSRKKASAANQMMEYIYHRPGLLDMRVYVNNFTALFFAINEQLSPKVVHRLLTFRCDPNRRCNGATPLDVALILGRVDYAEYLLAFGARVARCQPQQAQEALVPLLAKYASIELQPLVRDEDIEAVVTIFTILPALSPLPVVTMAAKLGLGAFLVQLASTLPAATLAIDNDGVRRVLSEHRFDVVSHLWGKMDHRFSRHPSLPSFRPPLPQPTKHESPPPSPAPGSEAEPTAMDLGHGTAAPATAAGVAPYNVSSLPGAPGVGVGAGAGVGVNAGLAGAVHPRGGGHNGAQQMEGVHPNPARNSPATVSGTDPRSRSGSGSATTLLATGGSGASGLQTSTASIAAVPGAGPQGMSSSLSPPAATSSGASGTGGGVSALPLSASVGAGTGTVPVGHSHHAPHPGSTAYHAYPVPASVAPAGAASAHPPPAPVPAQSIPARANSASAPLPSTSGFVGSVVGGGLNIPGGMIGNVMGTSSSSAGAGAGAAAAARPPLTRSQSAKGGEELLEEARAAQAAQAAANPFPSFSSAAASATALAPAPPAPPAGVPMTPIGWPHGVVISRESLTALQLAMGFEHLNCGKMRLAIDGKTRNLQALLDKNPLTEQMALRGGSDRGSDAACELMKKMCGPTAFQTQSEVVKSAIDGILSPFLAEIFSGLERTCASLLSEPLSAELANVLGWLYPLFVRNLLPPKSKLLELFQKFIRDTDLEAVLQQMHSLDKDSV